MSTDELRFRSAVEDDLPAVIELLADDYLGAQRELVGTEVHERYRSAFAELHESGHDVIVAERVGPDGPRLVGCVQYMVLPGLAVRGAKRAQVEGVRIATELRGGGLGRQLLEHVIARAAADGCDLVQLSVHESRSDARRFYESLGFEPSHVGFKLSL